MKTPISYYGGKQQFASKIVSLFPEHKIYCEPFIGGAAVFFAKPRSQAEIINDINSEVINFYEVLQHDFPALQAEISISLHSRKLHQHAQVFIKIRICLTVSNAHGLSGILQTFTSAVI